MHDAEMPAADGEKRESEDPEAEGPPSSAKSNDVRAKEREREMEEAARSSQARRGEHGYRDFTS